MPQKNSSGYIKTQSDKNLDKKPLRRLAVVLSGGGARGAYEIGVLCNLLPRFAAMGITIDILAGTSVGSLNACAIASTAHFPGVAGARLRAALLRKTWENIDESQIFIPRFKSALLALPLHIIYAQKHPEAMALSKRWKWAKYIWNFWEEQSPKFKALYDTTPLKQTLRDGNLINWDQLRTNINEGYLSALALSTTSIRTGETIVFTQTSKPTKAKNVPDEHLRFQFANIDYRHAMASGAIPFLFPPVKLPGEIGEDEGLYMDGGIRQNTPLSPAILLGADSMLVIGLHATAPKSPILDFNRPEMFEAVPILGKILNAFFLDRVRTDFNRLLIMNKLVETAEPEKLLELNNSRMLRGKDPLRVIRAIEITPSEDIGLMMSDLWRKRPDLHRLPWKTVFDAEGLHGSAFGDLLSYVFFHPEFTKALVKLGEDDAAREMKDSYLRWIGGLDDTKPSK